MIVRQAAELLTISKPTIERLVAQKKIPSYKVGKRRIFEGDELIEWVKSSRTTNPKSPGGNPKRKEHNMISPEKGADDLKRDQAEQKVMGYKKALFISGLLERIEKTRLEIENKATALKFDLYPRPAYEGNRDSDYFLKELTYLHTQYCVRHSMSYSSFCINLKADGIYWESGTKIKKLILTKGF